MGCGGGGDQVTTTTQEQVLKPYVERPLKDLIGRTENLTNQPYVAYNPEARVAPLSPDEMAAFDLIRQQSGAYRPVLDQAIAGTQDIFGMLGQAPDQGYLQGFMNPYLDEVLNRAKIGAERQYDIESQKVGDLFQTAGAFGGSRQAVAEDEMRDQYLDRVLDLEAQERSNAYQQALGQYNLQNQMGLSTAAQLANLSGLGQQQVSNQAGLLQQAGQAQRGVEQALADARYGEFMREQQWPYMQTSHMANILNPAMQATTGSTSQQIVPEQEDSMFGNILGTALSIGSIATGNPMGWLGLAGDLGGGTRVISGANNTRLPIPGRKPVLGFSAANGGQVPQKYADGGQVSMLEKLTGSPINLDPKVKKYASGGFLSYLLPKARDPMFALQKAFEPYDPGNEVYNPSYGNNMRNQIFRNFDSALSRYIGDMMPRQPVAPPKPVDTTPRGQALTRGIYDKYMSGQSYNFNPPSYGTGSLQGVLDRAAGYGGFGKGQSFEHGGRVKSWWERQGLPSVFLFDDLVKIGEGRDEPFNWEEWSGKRQREKDLMDAMDREEIGSIRQSFLDRLGDSLQEVRDAPLTDLKNPITEYKETEGTRLEKLFGAAKGLADPLKYSDTAGRAIAKAGIGVGDFLAEDPDSPMSKMKRQYAEENKELEQNAAKIKDSNKEFNKILGEDKPKTPVEAKQKGQTLVEQATKKAKPTENDPYSGVNIPMLMAGIAMIEADGDAFDAIGAGFKGYLAGKQHVSDKKTAAEDRDLKNRKLEAEIGKLEAEAGYLKGGKGKGAFDTNEFYDNLVNTQKMISDRVTADPSIPFKDQQKIINELTIQNMSVAYPTLVPYMQQYLEAQPFNTAEETRNVIRARQLKGQ